MVLIILGYIHVVFARAPINCLQSIQKTWPRNGILRVEIIRNASADYTIINSYEKEYNEVELDTFLSALESLGGGKSEADAKEDPEIETESDGFLESESANDTSFNGTIQEEKDAGGTIETSRALEDGEEESEHETGDDIEVNDTNATMDYKAEGVPEKNMQPFRETLSEFEMLTKAGKYHRLNIFFFVSVQ